MKIEVPLSEVLDRMSILELKLERFTDPSQRASCRLRLDALHAVWKGERPAEYDALKAVNTALWDIEEALRDHERRQDFGERFVTLARSVYQQNDRRAALKRAIDDRLGSRLVEEKSY